MNPDLIFLVGVIVLLGCIPAAISAFSSSDGTPKSFIACLLIGGGMIVLAMVENPGGAYTVNDLTRIAKDLVR